ncbi:hypothetical protein B0H11DRAFT_7607 [Mycena galericulata]|nr:hypothetical protein B0H11DRAFT_7607 [Mycena galericulata]
MFGKVSHFNSSLPLVVPPAVVSWMFSRRFRCWVLLAIFLASMEGTAHGQPSPTTTSLRRHAQNNINYYYARQLMPSPLTSSSSYDYWWPYPPADATTSPTATLVSFTPTDTPFLSQTDISTPVLAFSFDPDSAASSPSSSDSLTSVSMSATSSSASDSIISISARPPSNTSLPGTSNRKLSMVPTSNLVYIVPTCAVVGILVGGITAWCVYGCLTRNGHGRRRGRKSYGTLEVGPEYMPPTPHSGEKQELEEEEGEWVGDEKHVEESDGGDTVRGDASEDEQGTETETERFLHPGAALKGGPPRSPVRNKSIAATVSTTRARAKSSRSSRAPSPTPSGRTSLFFDRPDSTDALPWESLRHKSIKREILERLKDDGRQDSGVARRPWQTHGRHDSDLLLADAQASLSRASTSVTSVGVSRASSSVTARTGPGFCILSESPAETPQSERGPEVFAWPSVEDRYTRVPARVARSRSRSPEKASRASSPDKSMRAMNPEKLARAASPPVRRGGTGDGGRFNAQVRGRTAEAGSGGHASKHIRNVLPQSPPRISSPILDGALCFTPISSPLETTPEITSFASFGAPVSEEMGRVERGAGERTRRGRRSGEER